MIEPAVVVLITIPIQLPSLANARLHWARRAAIVKSQRRAVSYQWAQTGIVRGSLWFPCVVTFTRIAPRALDDDNLQFAFKALRDQLAEEMGLPNDRDPRVTWRYDQRKGKTPSVEIAITTA